MLPCNLDSIYEMFYVAVPYSQSITKVVLFYNTGIIFSAGIIIVGYILFRYNLTTV